ncbi:hypothetical protein LY78DRAFT_348536 [Colletotrichum sublineola]|nr:hypothetical protein LY78DRAFT_348536 [Colletotrichum sublineola]
MANRRKRRKAGKKKKKKGSIDKIEPAFSIPPGIQNVRRRLQNLPRSQKAAAEVCRSLFFFFFIYFSSSSSRSLARLGRSARSAPRRVAPVPPKTSLPRRRKPFYIHACESGFEQPRATKPTDDLAFSPMLPLWCGSGLPSPLSTDLSSHPSRHTPRLLSKGIYAASY